MKRWRENSYLIENTNDLEIKVAAVPRGAQADAIYGDEKSRRVFALPLYVRMPISRVLQQIEATKCVHKMCGSKKLCCERLSEFELNSENREEPENNANNRLETVNSIEIPFQSLLYAQQQNGKN